MSLLDELEPGKTTLADDFVGVDCTATSAVLAGSKLVFVDIRPDTMNIDETKIEEAIRTGGIEIPDDAPEEEKEKYRKLLKNIDDEVVFSKEEDVIWICRNCGHVVIGKKAPKVCPVCNHPQSYFEVKANNY